MARRKNKLSENTAYLLELFNARRIREVQQLVDIFEDRTTVDNGLATLKKRGDIRNVDRGVWELVQ